MEDKSTFVRNHILGMLENGELNAGEKLPGARELLHGSGISLPTIQNAIEILVREGVLETFARKGTFVQKQWQKRFLQQNLTVFRSGLTWFSDLRELIHREIPEVWVSLTHCAFFNWSSQMKSFSFEKYPELHKFRSGVNLWANGSVDSIQVSVPPHDVVYLRGTDQDYAES